MALFRCCFATGKKPRGVGADSPTAWVAGGWESRLAQKKKTNRVPMKKLLYFCDSFTK